MNRTRLLLFWAFVSSIAIIARADTYTIPDTNITLTYEVTDGEAHITDCNAEASGNLEIPTRLPDSIHGSEVTAIGSGAFSYCYELTGVIIPDSVTSIGDSAFTGCYALSSVSIPDTISSIQYGTFSGCSGLTGITIPNSVTHIGGNSFSSCSGLTNLTIPDSVTTIDSGAFTNCTRLTSLTIPGSVTFIDASAFFYCTGLTSLVISDSTTYLYDSSFAYCSRLTEVIFLGNAPTAFGYNVFLGSSASFTVKFYEGATGFTEPTWKGYSSVMLSHPDTDNDGWPDYLEDLLGTDSASSREYFRYWINTENGGGSSLNYGPHSEACTFEVEWCSDITADNWQTLNDLSFTGDLSVQTASLPTSESEQLFYRILIIPKD